MTTSATPSGKTVLLEDIIMENDSEKLLNSTRKIVKGNSSPIHYFERSSIVVPAPATCRGVNSDIYHSYRRGLAAACTDAVLVQHSNDGFKVPLIKRKNPPFQDCWWMTGGVQYNFVPLPLFALWKIMKEYGQAQGTIDDFMRNYGVLSTDLQCGSVNIVGPLGVVRTATSEVGANDAVCDTINVCLMAVSMQPLALSHDDDHTGIRLFSLNDLTINEVKHSYPLWAARKALLICHTAMRSPLGIL